MTTATTTENIEKLVRELGLKPGEDGLFYGKLKGFPVGFKLVESDGLGAALFQIRCPVDAGEKTGSKLSYGSEVDELIAEDKMEVSLENKVVWVTIVDGVKALDDGSAKRIYLAVLEAVEKAELKGESDRCHYCHMERVWDPICVNGHVAQICPACLEQRSQKDGLIEKAIRFIPAPLQCPLAVIVGTLVWAGFWIGYDLLFEWLNTNTIEIPHILIVVVAIGLGLVVGGPIGWTLRGLRKAQPMLATALMFSLAIVAVLLGEVLYVTWLFYHAVHVVAFVTAVRALPRIWAEYSGFYLVAKAITAALALAMAEVAAKKSAKSKVKL